MVSLPHDVDEFSAGYLLGLLAGEGHFGGDGRQPQITLRMHTRHERLFRWLELRFPGGRLYGPYHHAGRSYFQWLVRGVYLRRVIAPFIHAHRGWLDDHVDARFSAMCARYGVELGGGEHEPTDITPRGPRSGPAAGGA